ncbi:MAG: peptidylprolyl isomerase [Spirochaetota bacterium]
MQIGKQFQFLFLVFFSFFFTFCHASSKETATIETKFGKIQIRFFAKIAPKHVASFKHLARKGFYNGTTFHRVIPGFMIQGGDPKSKDANKRGEHGTGGPGYTLHAEFSNKKHRRGILSAARGPSPNSAGSQFFICVQDSFFLDKKYTVFGEVISGMDVVDKIVAAARDGMDNPLQRIEMKVSIQK